MAWLEVSWSATIHEKLTTGHGGASGYAEEILRPDLLIVEGGRSQVVNAKRRDRETALLGKLQYPLPRV